MAQVFHINSEVLQDLAEQIFQERLDRSRAKNLIAEQIVDAEKRKDLIKELDERVIFLVHRENLVSKKNRLMYFGIAILVVTVVLNFFTSIFNFIIIPIGLFLAGLMTTMYASRIIIANTIENSTSQDRLKN